MMKARLAAIVGAATLVFAGLGHAAVVPLRQSFMVAHPAGVTAGIALDGAGVAQVRGGYQFAIDPSWAEPGRFPSAAPDAPAGATVYALHVDPGGLGPAIAKERMAGQRAEERTAGHDMPFYSYLTSAGQYVLDVGTLSVGYSVPAKVAEVPLPGAIWLFGSGLLAFLGISSWRKY